MSAESVEQRVRKIGRILAWVSLVVVILYLIFAITLSYVTISKREAGNPYYTGGSPTYMLSA